MLTRSGCQQDQVLVRALFLACRRLPSSCALTWQRERESVPSPNAIILGVMVLTHKFLGGHKSLATPILEKKETEAQSTLGRRK